MTEKELETNLGTIAKSGSLDFKSNEALKEEDINIIEKELGVMAKFVVTYSDLEKLKYYLKQNDIEIINNDFNENVEVYVDITENKLEELNNRLNDLNFDIILQEILQEKYIDKKI